MLKDKFLNSLQKKNDDLNLTELQNKYKKFQNEYDSMSTEQ